MMKTQNAYLDDSKVNNAYYNTLGKKWYCAHDDPIALLRAEARLKSPWIAENLAHLKPKAQSVLDVGCGAGFLSNYLAQKKYCVTGVDLSESSLMVAKEQDTTKTVNYVLCDAYILPFEDGSFDCVTSTDFLEHVSYPQKILKEIYRVLKPDGIFFFHTFHKNLFSYFFAIKCVEWFVKNTPKDLHVYDLFIKPKDLVKWMNTIGFKDHQIRGIRPVFNRHFFKLLTTGVVSNEFSFKWSRMNIMTYIGYTFKHANPC